MRITNDVVWRRMERGEWSDVLLIRSGTQDTFWGVTGFFGPLGVDLPNGTYCDRVGRPVWCLTYLQSLLQDQILGITATRRILGLMQIATATRLPSMSLSRVKLLNRRLRVTRALYGHYSGASNLN
jgi:hypothetical protein